MFSLKTTAFVLLCAVHISFSKSSDGGVVSQSLDDREAKTVIGTFKFLRDTSALSTDSGWKTGMSDGHTFSTCPTDHYFGLDECKACDICGENTYEISPCSSKENTMCLSRKEAKIVFRCLHWRRLWHLKHLSLLDPGAKIFLEKRVGCHPNHDQWVKQFYVRLLSRGNSKISTLQWHNARPGVQLSKGTRTIVKREATVIGPSVPTPTSSTTPPDVSSRFDIDTLSFSDPQLIDPLNNKDRSKQNNSETSRRHPKKSHGKKKGVNGKISESKDAWHSSPVFDPGETKGVSPSIITSKTDDYMPSLGIQDGKIEEAGENAKEGDGSRILEVDSSGSSPTDPSSTDSSSTDWSWLYSVLAIVALVVAISFFVASRLRHKHLQYKNFKRSDKNCASPEVDKNDDVESYKMNEIYANETKELRNDRHMAQSFTCDEDIKMNNFSLRHSQSMNLDARGKTGSEMSLKSMPSSSSQHQLGWLTKASAIKSQNDFGSYHSEAETQTEGCDTLSHHSKTVFATPWQFGGSFSKEGGILQRKNSDVMLVVGRDAVLAGDFVQIQAAIFLDAGEIQRKFALSSDEMLITPLVEYHAEGSYQFQQYVSVKLPHALPDNYDTSLIKFYTFSVDDCGNINSHLLPLKSKENDVHGDAYWEISRQDRTFIAKTTHFSGYFCTTCESKAKLPSIYARVFGSHIQIKSNRREVRLILYLWDRRLNMKDFIEAIRQQECDMDRQLLADEPVPLLENATSDSSLVMRMETLGDLENEQFWRHVTRSNASRPLFKPVQVRKLRQVVLCCQQSDPMRVEWAMESMPNSIPSPVFQCLIEMVHVSEGEPINEDAFENSDEEYIRTFYVRNLKLSQQDDRSLPISSNGMTKQELLKTTMTRVMNRKDVENICQAFGIDEKEIGNLSQKSCSEDALKTELLEECSKKWGLENFIQALPHVLKQIQSFHVIQALQERGLLSNMSNYKSGHHSVTSNGLHQYGTPENETRESNTTCKSLCNRPVYESKQQNCSPRNNTNSGYHQLCRTPSNNHLKLNIDSNNLSLQNGTENSPDSDYYGSPPNLLGDNNVTVPNFPQRNPNVPPTKISNLPNSTAPHSTIPHSTMPYSTIPDSNIPHSTVLYSTIPHSTIPFSTIDNCAYTSSRNFEPCSEFDDDSCLATFDSQDLEDRGSINDSDVYDENTSKKELAVLTLEGSISRSAYPEIPEENKVSYNNPQVYPVKVELQSSKEAFDIDETFVKGD